MQTIRITKGRDIPLAGCPEARIGEAGLPAVVAIHPPDFEGFRPRVMVKEGDRVQIGTPVMENRDDARVRIVSPAQGKVATIRRGERRALQEIVIHVDDRQDAVPCTRFSPSQIPELSRQQIVEHLLATGSWALFRQRPFDLIANPDTTPKSIFIKAIDTNPLALDYDVVMQGRERDFQTGIDLLRKLTPGKVFLCVKKNTQSPALLEARGAAVFAFDGPHSAGNVGTHIHYLDPVDQNSVVWHIDAQDTAAVGKSFLAGNFSPERIVAVGGERAQNRVYQRTVRGARMRDLIGQETYDGTRVISGSVLSGADVGPEGFLGFYDSQVSVIPAGGQREFLGWASLGLKKFSFTRAFLSSLQRKKSVSLDGDQNGSGRAIVFNDVYDKYVALDVMTFFLVRAILAGEMEEAERLGLLECAPEDFALAAFACPSKTDVCGIIRQGLEILKENG